MMKKLSGLGGLKGFRSLAGSTSTAMKAANPKPSSDAGGSSFASLKIMAEKLVNEQVLVKTDFEMAGRATGQINLFLEGKFQRTDTENAKLKLKQSEDSKSWQGLDSKVLSTKTLCDQLTQTLQQLASQTERSEDKKFFEEKLGKNSTCSDEFNCMSNDLSEKLECAEQMIISGKQQMLQIKHKKEEMDRNYKEWLCANDSTIKEKDSLIKQLEGSVDEYKARLTYMDSRLQSMEQELKLNDDAGISLKENLADAESENNLELRNQGRSLEIAKLCKDNKDSTLDQNHQQELLVKISKLESNQGIVGQVQSIMDEKPYNAESLQGERAKCDQQVDTLENQVNQLRTDLDEKEQLHSFYVKRYKTLEEQKLQVEASLAATECQLIEARKQYDLMLEGKQTELSRHLVELSLKNDQAEKFIREIENKCNEKISENKKDSEIYLMHLKEEHGTTVRRHQLHKISSGRITKKTRSKTRSDVMFDRSHILAEKKFAKLRELSIPGNTGLVLLDEYNTVGSKRSFLRAISKAQSWCKANSIFIDLSKYMGPGTGVYTTPPTGTFHLTYLYRQRKHKRAKTIERRLTTFLHGRDLYVKGWRSTKGIFEIQPKVPNSKYIKDPACQILNIGENYHDYRKRGDINGVRIGLYGMMDHFDVMEKYDGTVSDAFLTAVAGFAINGPEPIRLSDVKDEILESYDNHGLVYLGSSRKQLSVQIRKYKHYSGECLKCASSMVNGESIPEIKNSGGLEITSFKELMDMVTVPLRGSYQSKTFDQENGSYYHTWVPPCPESMKEDEMLVEEDKKMEEEDDSVLETY